MSGSGSALNLALSYLKPGGRLSILGIPTKPVQIDVGRDIVFKGITIQGITGRRMFKTWYQVKDLVESGKLHLDQVVTHVMPWEDYEEAMKLMESGDCGKIVLMIHPKEMNDA
jgi:threonine 3-dehydrogenase